MFHALQLLVAGSAGSAEQRQGVSVHSEDAYLYTTMIERVNTVITALACRGSRDACSFRPNFTRPESKMLTLTWGPD